MMDAIKTFFSSALGLAWAAIFIVPFGNHIVWCIQAADQTGSAIALLLVGMFFPHRLASWCFSVSWVHLDIAVRPYSACAV